jgi:hypothetical protein
MKPTAKRQSTIENNDGAHTTIQKASVLFLAKEFVISAILYRG